MDYNPKRLLERIFEAAICFAAIAWLVKTGVSWILEVWWVLAIIIVLVVIIVVIYRIVKHRKDQDY